MTGHYFPKYLTHNVVSFFCVPVPESAREIFHFINNFGLANQQGEYTTQIDSTNNHEDTNSQELASRAINLDLSSLLIPLLNPKSVFV